MRAHPTLSFPIFNLLVVPLPLPLPAIMILVIGKLRDFLATTMFPHCRIKDLGFELFAALSFAWDLPESSETLMRLLPRKPVNDRSILSRKRKALQRTKTITRDPETLEIIPDRWWKKTLRKLKKPFTRRFWEDVWEQNDDETLVDT
jgi:sodium/potassium-transporting ATPase subunit alpha